MCPNTRSNRPFYRLGPSSLIHAAIPGTQREKDKKNSDFKIAVLAMRQRSSSGACRASRASLYGRDASVVVVEREYEKEFFASRSSEHSPDMVREMANSGSDPLVSSAHSGLARGVAIYSAGRHQLAMPGAMRRERLDPTSGPSSSSYDVSIFF